MEISGGTIAEGKMLKDPDVKVASDEAAPAQAVKRDVIAPRRAAGQFPEQMAELPGRRQNNASRLKSVCSELSQWLAKVEERARVLFFDFFGVVYIGTD